LTSFADAAAALGSQWSVVCTLEGSGNSDGLFYYCSTVPTYAAADANYRPWLRAESWPDILSESVDPMGGFPEAGSITVDLIDIDDTLTREWRTERGPVTLSDGEPTIDQTTLDVDDASNLQVNDVIFLGNEAIKIGGISSNQLTGLTRGALDTDAVTHPDDAEIYLSTPYLRGRRIRFYLIPTDADSAGDMTAFGVYHLDSFQIAEDFNGYVLQGRSQLKYLDRLVAHDPAVREFVVNSVSVEGLLYLQASPPYELTGPRDLAFSPWPDREVYLKFDDEILLTETVGSAPRVKILKRGQLGTKPDDSEIVGLLNEGETEGTPGSLVLGADPEGAGAFRYIPAATWEGLSAWTPTRLDEWYWQKSAHFIDIMLCLLTSSAGDDGLELVNAPTSPHEFGNWSSLPQGYGLGIPHALIDFESFLEIKARTPDFVFPYFNIGEEAIKLREIVADQILKPIGAYVTTESGQITLRMPRIPLAQEALTAWDDSTILTTRSGLRQRAPDMRVGQDVSRVKTAVKFKLKNATGGDTSLIFNDSNFTGWNVNRSYYARDESPLEFEMPAVKAEGSRGFLERLGLRKLFRFRRPIWQINTTAGYDQYARLPGDLIGLTNSELPDTEEGTRGWSDVACEIIGREISATPDYTGIRFTLLAFATTRTGRVSPSAYIMGTSGPDGDGNYTLTVASTLYTDPASLGTLPTNDAQAFTAGDIITLSNTDGSDAASTVTQAVESVAADTVVINGNFSGALAAGLIVVYADRSAAVSDQYERFVYFAATTDSPPNVGSSTDKPWRFGE